MLYTIYYMLHTIKCILYDTYYLLYTTCNNPAHHGVLPARLLADGKPGQVINIYIIFRERTKGGLVKGALAIYVSKIEVSNCN